jgi:hypothetical protein
MAFDLTAGRNGLAKLGEVMTLWIRHMLGIDVEIEPLNAMRCQLQLVFGSGC